MNPASWLLVLMFGCIVGCSLIGLAYDRWVTRRDAARNVRQHSEASPSDEDFFAALRVTDEDKRATRRAHGWCSCVAPPSDAEHSLITDPQCPLHGEVAR